MKTKSSMPFFLVFVVLYTSAWGIFVVTSNRPALPEACGRDTTELAPFTVAPQIAKVKDAVVHIEKRGVCQGSGCLIGPEGIIFTARHISDGEAGEYVVTLDDGREFGVKYVVEDTENDVCFMLLDLDAVRQEPNLPYVCLSGSDPCVGDGVIVGGSPLGRDNFNTFSFGIVSAVDRDLYNRRGWEQERRFDWHVMIQITSPAFPGNSGGPIFDLQGDVIGVLVAGQAETLCFGVPVARFRGTIDTVRNLFALRRFNVVGEVYDACGI